MSGYRVLRSIHCTTSGFRMSGSKSSESTQTGSEPVLVPVFRPKPVPNRFGTGLEPVLVDSDVFCPVIGRSGNWRRLKSGQYCPDFERPVLKRPVFECPNTIQNPDG